MAMLAEACAETLPAMEELAAGVTRQGDAEGRRWSLMEGVGARRLHLVCPPGSVPYFQSLYSRP